MEMYPAPAEQEAGIHPLIYREREPGSNNPSP